MFQRGGYYTVVVLTVVLSVCSGCHPRDDKNKGKGGDDAPVRSKRQAPVVSLEEYFAGCIGSYPRRQRIYLPTVVDYTIRQTSWFSKTDVQYCPGDTVDCWRYLVRDYLQQNSELLFPAKRCIEQYGIDRGRPALTVESFRFGVNQARSSHSPLNIDITSFEGQIRQIQPSDPADDSLRDVRSLVSFFQQDAVCALDFCDCTGINLPPGEVCGQNWYTRFAALTRVDSPIRPAVVAATNAAISRALNQPTRTVPQNNPALSDFIRILVTKNLLERICGGLNTTCFG